MLRHLYWRRPLGDFGHFNAQESIPEVLKMMTGFWTFCCFLSLVVAVLKQRQELYWSINTGKSADIV